MSKTIKKILIVEDEGFLFNILCDKIKQGGYKIQRASNGIEAIEKFKKEEPDLILLDILMPGMNGYEVLREIREKYKSDIPIIVLSNLEQRKEMEYGKKLGADEYLLKSNTSLKELLEKINKVLN